MGVRRARQLVRTRRAGTSGLGAREAKPAHAARTLGRCQRSHLDVAHIRRWLQEFAQITDDGGEIVARFERAWESRPHASS